MKSTMFRGLAALCLLALPRAEAFVTVNINDARFDVQWLVAGGSAGTSLVSAPTALGCWDYSFTIAPSDPGCSVFYGTVNYLVGETLESNVFSGTMNWGTQVYDWTDRYASGDSMRRLTTYASNAIGDGAFVMHVARTGAVGVPDAGSSIALFAAALLLVGGVRTHWMLRVPMLRV